MTIRYQLFDVSNTIARIINIRRDTSTRRRYDYDNVIPTRRLYEFRFNDLRVYDY